MLRYRVYRQGRFHTAGIDIAVDAPVRVAGQVVQDGAPLRRLVEPLQRYDREYLVDAPHIGHGLEHRQVAEHLVGQALVDVIQFGRCW